MIDRTLANPTSFADFVTELQRDILPIYLRHEIGFDPSGVHGRMHICRSLIFAECIARRYQEGGAEIDFYAIRVATAMHDSGRRANGIDYWESDSVDLCLQYLRTKAESSAPSDYTAGVAKLIRKGGEKEIAHHIVYDADVLEIMRPCCGRGGLAGFKPEFLHFGSHTDNLRARIANLPEMRQTLISEAWNWIVETERLKPSLARSAEYMTNVLHFLDRRRNSYPMLRVVLDGIC